jgi:hypothetical protein
LTKEDIEEGLGKIHLQLSEDAMKFALTEEESGIE